MKMLIDKQMRMTCFEPRRQMSRRKKIELNPLVLKSIRMVEMKQ